MPNDTFFADGQVSGNPAVGQWYLRAPDATAVSAVNALGAWAITEGSASVVVAVLDTGVRLDHPDLAGKLKPGYDFIANTTTAADGGGRDADPSDPGDYNPTSRSGCATSNSSWHGTQVAGLVGAATDNGIGMAGTGRNTMVLPVRVLGRCGGFDDDIQAGMRWAGGLSNTAGCTTVSATCNPNPARVINLSLGSSGTCSTAYRTLISELNAAGVSVVVAAGNENGLAVDEPANCAGAIAVAGIRHAGTKVGYSSLGPEVALAAPAGNCVNTTGPCLYPLLTTDNDGTTTPGNNIYSSGSAPSLGTSFASPIVAGTVGLMLAANSGLTPAQVRSMLRDSARAFPTTGAQEPGTVACVAPSATEQIECYCTTSTCGAGMLDARAAVAQAAAAVAAPTAAISATSTAVTVGGQLTLSATGSTANGGRSIASYGWAVTSSSGSSVVSLSATSGSSTVLTALGAGTVTLQLTVTDSAGASGTASTTITINAVAPPTASFNVAPASPTAGSAATLDAAGSSAFGGRSIATYLWQITSGAGIASLASATGSTTTLTTTGAGTVTVQLTVTDSTGATGAVSQAITVAAAPVVVSSSGGGGGGAMGLGWVLGLVAATVLLWRGRPSAGSAPGSSARSAGRHGAGR